MTAHMKKQHLKAAIVGVIAPIIQQLHFYYDKVEYDINTNVEHYSSVVELTIKAKLTPIECKAVSNALNLIKTDGAITFRDDNGFH